MKHSNNRTYKSNGCNLWIIMMYLTLNKLQAKKKDEYKEAMGKRIFYVQSRIKKEQEEKAKLKYF